MGSVLRLVELGGMEKEKMKVNAELDGHCSMAAQECVEMEGMTKWERERERAQAAGRESNTASVELG